LFRCLLSDGLSTTCKVYHDARGRLQVYNQDGSKRVIVTKDLPGDRWVNVLVNAGCRVEVCTDPETILSVPTIKKFIGSNCDGAIGQLTGAPMFPDCSPHGRPLTLTVP